MSETKFACNPLAAWTEINGNVVLVSPADSVLHELNPTASFIWKHAAGELTAAEAARLLTSEFEVAPEVARADAEEFLALLTQKRLFVQQPAPRGEG